MCVCVRVHVCDVCGVSVCMHVICVVCMCLCVMRVPCVCVHVCGVCMYACVITCVMYVHVYDARALCLCACV